MAGSEPCATDIARREARFLATGAHVCAAPPDHSQPTEPKHETKRQTTIARVLRLSGLIGRRPANRNRVGVRRPRLRRNPFRKPSDQAAFALGSGIRMGSQRGVAAAHSDDRAQSFRRIATTWSNRLRPVARAVDRRREVHLQSQACRWSSSGREAVPGVNRRDPRALRSALTADEAARAGGAC